VHSFIFIDLKEVTSKVLQKRKDKNNGVKEDLKGNTYYMR